jgi:hypothetical protein
MRETENARASNTFERSLRDVFAECYSHPGTLDNSRRFAYIDGFYAHRIAIHYLDVWRIYVPDACRARVGKAFHDDFGHYAGLRTYLVIARYFWFPGISAYYHKYAAHCLVCQQVATKRGNAPGTLFPQPIAKMRWRKWFLDILPSMPPTARGFDAILAVMDSMSRFIILIETQTSATSKDIGYFLLNRVIAIFGAPDEVDMDGELRLNSKDMFDFWSVVGVTVYANTADHYCANDIERRLQDVHRVVRARSYSDPTNWDLYLGETALAVNSVLLRTLHMSAADACLGWTPSLIPALPQLDGQDGRAMPFAQLLDHQRGVLQMIRDLSDESSLESKAFHERTHHSQEFNVGDQVMVYLYRLTRLNAKNSARWLGPFRVSEVVKHHGVCRGNYRIELSPDLARVHPIFHTSFLKPFLPPLQGQAGADQPGPVLSEGPNQYLMTGIVKHRFDKRRHRYLFLVSWEGYPADSDTEEPVASFNTLGARQLLQDYCKAHCLTDVPMPWLDHSRQA